MVMFSICVDEKGNQSEDIISSIRLTVRASLDLHPQNENLIRNHLATNLSLPGVMGPNYRYLWVDKIGSSFFIIIATHIEGGGRGKPVLVWAIRRKVGDTLRDICMDTIIWRLRKKIDVDSLGLPKTLRNDLIESFERISVNK